MTDEELQRVVDAQQRAAAVADAAAHAHRAHQAHQAHHNLQARHPAHAHSAHHPAMMGISPAAASMLRHQEAVANRAAMMDNLNASGWFGPQAQAAMIHKQVMAQAVAAAAVAAGSAAPHPLPPQQPHQPRQSQPQPPLPQPVQRDASGAIIPIGFFRDPQGNAWAASLQHPSQAFLNEINGEDSGMTPNNLIAPRQRQQQPKHKHPSPPYIIDLQSDDDDEDDECQVDDEKERGRLQDVPVVPAPSQQQLSGSSQKDQRLKSPQRQGTDMPSAGIAAALRKDTQDQMVQGPMATTQTVIASSKKTPPSGPINADDVRPSSGSRPSAHAPNPRSNLQQTRLEVAAGEKAASSSKSSAAMNKQQQDFLKRLKDFHTFQQETQQQQQQLVQQEQDQRQQQQEQKLLQQGQKQQAKQQQQLFQQEQKQQAKYDREKHRKEREENREQQKQERLEMKQQLKQNHLDDQLRKKLQPTKQTLAAAFFPPPKRPKMDSAPSVSIATKVAEFTAHARASPSDLEPHERLEQPQKYSGAPKNPPIKVITGPFVQRWLGPGPNPSERDRDVKEFMDKVLMSTTGYTSDTAPASLPFPPAEITLDTVQFEELAQDLVTDKYKAIREAVRCSYVEMKLRHDEIVQDQKRDSEELHQHRREVAMLSLKHRNALNDLKAEHDTVLETMRQQITDLQQELQIAKDECKEAKATQAKSLETMMKASILSLRMIRKTKKDKQ